MLVSALTVVCIVEESLARRSYPTEMATLGVLLCLETYFFMRCRRTAIVVLYSSLLIVRIEEKGPGAIL